MQRTAGPPHVPPRALALSLAAFAIPVVAVAWMPDWTSTGAGMLIWLTALIPAFLLSYYRGLRGVAVALAGGMAVITATQLSVVMFEIAEPNWVLLGAIVVTYLGVSIGIAVLAELLLKERRAAEALALVDRMTGLPNRRHLEDALEREFAAAERGRSLSVVLFDLDHFKQVNDRHGHLAGDHAIKAFAKILASNTRRENLSGRFGGEEFVSLLRDTEPEPALVFVQRVLSQMRDWPLPWGRLTASAGIAHYQKGMGSYEILLGEADRALYRAKHGGRDMVCVAAPYEHAAHAVAPAAAPSAEPSAEPSAAALTAPSGRGVVPDRASRPRVWIIDDDAWMRSLLKRMLEEEGVALWDTGDATEAIERFRDASVAERPDIILTDVIMPVMTGMRMIDQIAKISPDLRVIYMSGYVQSVIDWQGPPSAVVTFLSKPIAREVLREAVQNMLLSPISRTPDAPPG